MRCKLVNNRLEALLNMAKLQHYQQHVTDVAQFRERVKRAHALILARAKLREKQYLSDEPEWKQDEEIRNQQHWLQTEYRHLLQVSEEEFERINIEALLEVL